MNKDKTQHFNNEGVFDINVNTTVTKDQSQQENEIEKAITSFQEWCGYKDYLILFDSDIDGDGSEKQLMTKVLNKSHLLFIIHTEDNVFGGYFSKNVTEAYEYRVEDNYLPRKMYLYDPNCFLFSLYRNGQMRTIKYPQISLKHNRTFRVFSSLSWLFDFGGGNDMLIYPINSERSYCRTYSFDYDNERNPFVDKIYPYKFSANRIVVIQMN